MEVWNSQHLNCTIMLLNPDSWHRCLTWALLLQGSILRIKTATDNPSVIHSIKVWYTLSELVYFINLYLVFNVDNTVQDNLHNSMEWKRKNNIKKLVTYMHRALQMTKVQNKTGFRNHISQDISENWVDIPPEGLYVCAFPKSVCVVWIHVVT